MAVVKSNGYEVVIGEEVPRALTRFLAKKKYSSVFIICDENTLVNCLPVLVTSCPLLASASIIELESGESNKSVEICAQIWQTLIEESADKSSLILNLGGGVVSDTGGFCASVFKRGIDFVNVPTTLLSMADASIGGKTGVNLARVKNVLGTITQPQGVFIDPGFLKTLPRRHYLNGLCEIYKIALISDASFWKILKDPESIPPLKLIKKSVELKNAIVMKDPFDKGKRMVLNFGHTIGHAIESAAFESGTDILHGEAVLAGMAIESHLAWQKKMLSKKQLDEIISVLGNVFGFMKVFPGLKDLEPYLKNDKKNSGNTLLFSFINGIGSCKINVLVTKSQITKALEFYKTIA